MLFGFCDWIREPWRLGMEEALAVIRAHGLPGVGFIVLRTTDLGSRHQTEIYVR